MGIRLKNKVAVIDRGSKRDVSAERDECPILLAELKGAPIDMMKEAIRLAALGCESCTRGRQTLR